MPASAFSQESVQFPQTSRNRMILERIREMGLTREDVQRRLVRAGYSPDMADPYFDAIETGVPFGTTEVQVGEQLLEAFRRIGLPLEPEDPSWSDSLMWAREPIEDEFPLDSDSSALQVFGSRVFKYTSSAFDPVLAGPVGEDYLLAPGDELQLIITGDVELIHTLNVTREGYIVIPAVGEVPVHGITLQELRNRLNGRLGAVYSGITGEPSTTYFNVSIGRLRTNHVRVLGEVLRPGSYQISSVGTLLEALYFAGGPTDDGSYRQVLLRRRGEDPVEIDLYPYLTSGQVSQDLRLNAGDVVFVPTVGPQVTVSGNVRRPAVFEVREAEDLADLVDFAGGLLPNASTERAQLNRILPSAQRPFGGVDRIVLDVPLGAVLSREESFELAAGDELEVFAVNDRIRGSVVVLHGVWRPGRYEFETGMTLGDLVRRAGGLVPDAISTSVSIARLNQMTNRRSAIYSDLVEDPEGPVLAEHDIVEVFSHTYVAQRRSLGDSISTLREWDPLTVQDSIPVFGLVENPGYYPLVDGMAARDLILHAGGFVQGAQPSVIDVVVRDFQAGEQIFLTRKVRLPAELSDFTFGSSPDSGLVDADAVFDLDLPLTAGDEVYVRSLPGYETSRRVEVYGEIVFPGSYAIVEGQDRISDLIDRAGGVTQDADIDGFRFIREGVFVGIGGEDEGSNSIRRTAQGLLEFIQDPLLVHGDSIEVPRLDNTVTVTGAVNFPSRVVFRSGLTVESALSEAGGPTELADVGRISVRYSNGSRRTTSSVLWLFERHPSVRPGSLVYVPEKIESESTSWADALQTMFTLSSTIATLLILYNQTTN